MDELLHILIIRLLWSLVLLKSSKHKFFLSLLLVFIQSFLTCHNSNILTLQLIRDLKLSNSVPKSLRHWVSHILEIFGTLKSLKPLKLLKLFLQSPKLPSLGRKKLKPNNLHPLSKEKPLCVPPKVRLTKINSNDEVHVLHLNEIACLSKYLSTIHEVTQASASLIPKEYEDLTEVFSKNKAYELPPSCGSLDHHIHLEEGSRPIFGPIYNLSETELQVFKEYIHENLRKCLSVHLYPHSVPLFSSSRNLIVSYIYTLIILPSTVLLLRTGTFYPWSLSYWIVWKIQNISPK